ncbi:PDZ domain-containing protein [Luteolibacter marinus]|uniref:PDZ domain-containing protein n=1 Tax=Luteolibacter marinus TaxID=2776705 RepID=UPI00186731E4|nr:PDZ domain-containing protein [Luteolibacter marinus]
MKIISLITICLTGWLAAEGPGPDAVASGVIRGGEKAPWLGLKIGRLDEATRAHVPHVPEGIGFVVTSVEPGGPAEKAGMKAYDILWRFDDQWIANEAQLFTLLRLRKDGEQVPLGIYRKGEAMTLKVTLGHPPEPRVLTHTEVSAGAQDAPMKVLNPAERTAEIELADGKAVLSLVAGVAEVTIVSSDGAPVYQGPVYDFKGVCQVPDPWKPRVGALERALAHAMQGNFTSRPARTRVVPAAERVEE